MPIPEQKSPLKAYIVKMGIICPYGPRRAFLFLGIVCPLKLQDFRKKPGSMDPETITPGLYAYDCIICPF